MNAARAAVGAFVLLLPVISLLAQPAGLGIPIRSPGERLAAIEKPTGGRLGVAAWDTNTGRRVEYRSAERFAMCSTFKLLLAAAVLTRIDEKKESLDRPVPFSSADLLEYAPVTKAHLPDGSMTVAALCAASVQDSDNTAANLLLRIIGGPPALTRYARSLGDPVTRLDRYEPDLNSNEPGDPRDTTSPSSMLDAINRLVTGNALSSASRIQLESWLTASTTGATRLRAGFPPGWRVGDKTGTGANGASNDIAIAWPPNGRPVIVVAYLTDSRIGQKERDAVLADVAKIVVAEFGRKVNP